MGQAKQRKAEIMALKAKPKFKAHQEGFRPDAGLNSQEGTNHYWLQVGELLQAMSVNPKLKSYNIDGVRKIELNAAVDIMNYEGTEHTSPQTREGYFATFLFTPDGLENLANQIDKGAMSVRVSGIPRETSTSIITGEKFKDIDATDSWAKGNTNGFMTYMFFNGTKMVSFDSKTAAQSFRAIAEQMRSE